MAELIDLAERRPKVVYTVRIMQGYDGFLSVYVEDVASDAESRRRVAAALRRGADLIESDVEPEAVG